MNLVHSKDDLLQLQVEKFWRSDFSDCLAESRVSMSLEDKQALEIMKETVTLVKGHYQIGLQWKGRPPFTNRELTNRRLLHDGAVGLRDMLTAHGFLGTCRRRGKVNDLGKRDLPAS